MRGVRLGMSNGIADGHIEQNPLPADEAKVRTQANEIYPSYVDGVNAYLSLVFRSIEFSVPIRVLSPRS